MRRPAVSRAEELEKRQGGGFGKRVGSAGQTLGQGWGSDTRGPAAEATEPVPPDTCTWSPLQGTWRGTRGRVPDA